MRISCKRTVMVPSAVEWGGIGCYCGVSNNSSPFYLGFTWEPQLQISWPSRSVLSHSLCCSFPFPTMGTQWKYKHCALSKPKLAALPCPRNQGVLLGVYCPFFRPKVVWFSIDYLVCVITSKTTGISSLIDCKLEIYWLGWTPNDQGQERTWSGSALSLQASFR